ncbi:IS30 family transposase [Erysipelothrix rhusiopathiae]|uniref:IS30 family transposase n=2 Tax=Erysipelothrix rhusiopathiae TaxID=1648 RepID=UPI002ED6E4EC
MYYRSKTDRPELDIPSFSTIYRWIHLGLIVKGDMKKLRRKGKFKIPQETRGRFNIGKTINKRPKSVYKREEIGHWEADTVESGRIGHKRKSSYCLVTLVERKSRYTLSTVLPNRKEESVTQAIIEMVSTLPSYMVNTITCNRGKEFSGYEKIEEALSCDIYFADPYCSWQRGTNENTNGLLREYYPKGMDLSLVTEFCLEE